jgi:phosphoesterase, MJ0936 family
MIKVGILSDTHGQVDEKVLKFFESCNQIWHCGDIGSPNVIKKLRNIAPVFAVYGNIDGQNIRIEHPLYQSFQAEKVKTLFMHIGGYPGRYTPEARELIAQQEPKIFLAGHSHILKVIFDKKNDLLFVNPGAAGFSGFHTVRTAVRLTIDGQKIKDLEIGEWPRRQIVDYLPEG